MGSDVCSGSGWTKRYEGGCGQAGCCWLARRLCRRPVPWAWRGRRPTHGKAVLDCGGIDALRAMPAQDRPARLDAEQLQALGRALLQSPTEHGFEGELWTLRRVGVLIRRLHGVEFSQTQVWRLLGSLGFSSQKPGQRALERDEQAVRTWKRTAWPALKKSPTAKAA